MNAVLVVAVVLLIAWLLGIGNVVHVSATVSLNGGIETVLVAVLVVALMMMVVRRIWV